MTYATMTWLRGEGTVMSGNDDGARERRLEDAAADAKDEARRSGRAWQARDIDRTTEALQSEGGVQDLVGEVVSDAFLGQRAGAMVEDPPFEASSSSILDQPIVVVYQEAKFVEVSDEYHYALADGTDVALGTQTNQGLGRKLLRVASKLDSKMKSVVEVVQDGQPVFTMERKGSVGKNTMVITDAGGDVVGEVKQTKRGRKRGTFELIAGGETLATMQAGHVRTSPGYDIVAPDGDVVAYVRRFHEGVLKSVGKAGFSKADSYVLRFARQLEDPLRTLIVATPMSVDSAVNQDRDGMDQTDVKRMLRPFR